MPRVKVKLRYNPPGTHLLWMSSEIKELFEVLRKEIDDFNEFAKFMGDLFTFNELLMAGLRWQIARKIWEGEKSYAEIAEELGCGVSTVTRVAACIYRGEGGFHNLLLRLVDTMKDKKRLEREKKEAELIERIKRPRYKGIRI